MIRSAVTVSLVPEARGGPFVFWDDLPAACSKAAKLGFDGVELFLPAPDAVRPDELRALLDLHKLQLAAFGTGAGWVKHKLTLTDASFAHRARAIDFIKGMIDLAGPFGAGVIVGSMQGRWGGDVSLGDALFHLNSALIELGNYAGDRGARLIFEPLNRYETNVLNTLGDSQETLKALTMARVDLLADLFHMNIEEVDLFGALVQAGAGVGHVHLADSNRRPA